MEQPQGSLKVGKHHLTPAIRFSSWQRQYSQNEQQQKLHDEPPSNDISKLSLSSRAIHADDPLNIEQDVAPSLHVSTTFRYSKDPDVLQPITRRDDDGAIQGHIYSRHTAPNTTRFEAILSSLLNGPALTYSSGLAAFHALLVLLNPKSISIGDGYHGCHGVIKIHQRLTGLRQLDLDCAAEELQPGDIIHVETPLNPTGLVRNLKAYAKKAHSRGAFLTVDATFGPPPLQDPFSWGADIVLHSGTKYFGGHSDMLCGILARDGFYGRLAGNQKYKNVGDRVEKQAYNVGKLVAWLDAALHPENESSVSDTTTLSSGNSKIVRDVIEKLQHASLQETDLKEGWLRNQMPHGFGPVFAMTMKTEDYARKLPSKLQLFHHATSLGGVESLIEWRSMSDSTVDTRLMRVSIGIESWEDLRNDLLSGFKSLVEEA